MGRVLGVLQRFQRQVRGNDQRLPAAVPAVNHVVNVFMRILGVPFNPQIVQYQQFIAAEPGNVFVAPRKAGGKVIEYRREVRHADGNLFFHEGVCNAPGKVAFAAVAAAPQKIADIICFHGFPLVNIGMGVVHLRRKSVVVRKRPFLHGFVGKAPLLQTPDSFQVGAPLLGGFPLFTLCPLAVTFCRVAVTPEKLLALREISLFRLAALPAV